MRLQSLILNLTERCNFACAHCSLDCGPEGEDMALSDALSCLQLAARAKADSVFLTGGEATLHPGLLSCIEQAASLGLYNVLPSNGSFRIDRLEDFKLAGLRELHVSYNRFAAHYISSDRVKRIIDSAVRLDITTVLVIIEPNSYAKYEAVFGDYLRFCQLGLSSFRPIIWAGRATRLPRSLWGLFKSDTLLAMPKSHGFGIFVSPGGRVSFCPVNQCFASTTVDLGSDWLDGVVDAFSREPTVRILVDEGVSGLLRRSTGTPTTDWCSPFYECNLCIEATMRQQRLFGQGKNKNIRRYGSSGQTNTSTKSLVSCAARSSGVSSIQARTV